MINKLLTDIIDCPYFLFKQMLGFLYVAPVLNLYFSYPIGHQLLA